MEEKGIGDAIRAVQHINESLGRSVFSLDIYGPIASEFEETFGNLRKKTSEYINYCGVVSSGNSADILKKYFIMLFPTHYHGEGFAGTILDALAAGVPIVASDWRYNSEIVTDDVGYVYPTHNQNAFEEILQSIAENPGDVLKKKKKCLEKAMIYTDVSAMKTIATLLE